MGDNDSVHFHRGRVGGRLRLSRHLPETYLSFAKKSHPEKNDNRPLFRKTTELHGICTRNISERSRKRDSKCLKNRTNRPDSGAASAPLSYAPTATVRALVILLPLFADLSPSSFSPSRRLQWLGQDDQGGEELLRLLQRSGVDR